jgi:hypothetical protein
LPPQVGPRPACSPPQSPIPAGSGIRSL